MSTYEKPKGARHWARVWGVHHNTARRLLRHLRRNFGSRVVWQVGPQRALVATKESLQVVKVLRAGRDGPCILVVNPTALPTRNPGSDLPDPPKLSVRAQREDEDDDPPVTQEQHSRALSEVWRAIRDLQATRRK